jgi:uncharacterized membrane protein YphA (DoxX/SURF4 family)
MTRKTSFLDEVGDTHALAAARIAFGILLLFQAWETASEQFREGFFGAHFHDAFIPERFVPSERVYTFVVCVQAICGVLIVLGHFARPALFYSACAIAYAMLCDRLHFHHNRWALACYAALLSFSPCDRSWALGVPLGSARDSSTTAPLWAVWLARVQVSIVYLASGSAKLLDRDWRSGQVLYDRFIRSSADAIQNGVPERVVAFFSQEGVWSFFAKGAITIELFLAFALQTRRLRIPALFIGLIFHAMIQLSARVELFSFTTLAAYFFFATPDFRARTLRFDPARKKSVALAWAVRSLDWLARFEVAPWVSDSVANSRSFVVTDRDGTPYTGFLGVMALMRALPLTFPIWAIAYVLFPFARTRVAS